MTDASGSKACRQASIELDSRPTWDDTGITVGCVFLAAALLATIRSRAAWLIAFAVGTPVLAFNAALHGNVGSAVAIAIALVGAGIGYVIGKTLTTTSNSA